jgi:hypothetical protein
MQNHATGLPRGIRANAALFTCALRLSQPRTGASAMKRLLCGLAVAVLTGLASGAGGDGGGGGGGGGTEVGPKRDAAYQAGVQAIERQDWPKAIKLFQTSLCGTGSMPTRTIGSDSPTATPAT